MSGPDKLAAAVRAARSVADHYGGGAMLRTQMLTLLAEYDRRGARITELEAQRQDVLDLHPRDVYGEGTHWEAVCCGSCRDGDEEPSPWPCQTAAALGGDR